MSLLWTGHEEEPDDLDGAALLLIWGTICAAVAWIVVPYLWGG